MIKQKKILVMLAQFLSQKSMVCVLSKHSKFEHALTMSKQNELLLNLAQFLSPSTQNLSMLKL